MASGCPTVPRPDAPMKGMGQQETLGSSLSFSWAKNSGVFSSSLSEGSQGLAICFSSCLFETCFAYM